VPEKKGCAYDEGLLLVQKLYEHPVRARHLLDPSYARAVKGHNTRTALISLDLDPKRNPLKVELFLPLRIHLQHHATARCSGKSACDGDLRAPPVVAMAS